jgi:L-alanine-DL-glutamate epimerase-like enolase superfamily enzyme
VPHQNVKSAAIEALQPKAREGTTLVRVRTDAGVTGYGPCGRTSGPAARAAIAALEGPRLPHLGLIGKDPRAIAVHHHNMFYAYRQRARSMQVLSAIDVALWDVTGKLLGEPVHRLLGGPFRDELPLYSHSTGDIHHALGIPMQQSVTTISPGEGRKVREYYALARESFGEHVDIIVHCHAELDVPSAIRVAAAVEPIAPLFYEDPLDPSYSEAWLALRRQTRLPIMTGENLALAEAARPFLDNQAVDVLQPDLMNAGGITGTKLIADLAGTYRIPVCLHNVSGYVLNLASQQFSAGVFNCPMMECRRDADRAPEAAANAPVIRNGKMQVSDAPGLGIELDLAYLNANRAEGEPEWGPD